MRLTRRPRHPNKPFDDLEAFLENLFLHLLACKLTQTLAPPVGQLLTDLEGIRASRRALSRAVFALTAKAAIAIAAAAQEAAAQAAAELAKLQEEMAKDEGA